MTAHKVPIALFVYKRPEHTKAVLESLSRCAGLDRCQVHIYCDGPRQPADTDAVRAARKVVEQWAPALKAEVVHRAENLGLALSITKSVSELCDSYGRVMVLEDDLVLHHQFVNFMLRSLDEFADSHDVYQISGFSFPVTVPSGFDAYFLPMCSTWGWATWGRAWKHFQWNLPDAMEVLTDPIIRNRFDLDGTYPYAAMLTDALQGKVDSWGIRWQYAVFRRSGLALYPRTSLVWNAGFDSSGTHCRTGFGAWQPAMPTVLESPFPHAPKLSSQITQDTVVYRRLKTFLKMHLLTPARPWWRRIASRLRNVCHHRSVLARLR